MSIKSVILYALFALTGALGGCAAGSHLLMKKNDLRLVFLVAYGIIGAAMGLATSVLMLWWAETNFEMITDPEINRLFTVSLLSGGIGSSVLGGIHIVSKIILRWKGIEVTVEMKKHQEIANEAEGSE